MRKFHWLFQGTGSLDLKFSLTLMVSMLLLCYSCGYKIRGSTSNLPAGIESLGIPTFRNLTNQYKIEQLISSAVLREFYLRTRVPVKSSSSGVDAILFGEIGSVSSIPLTYGLQTYGSAFLVTVQMSVKLIRLKDSTVIWQNNSYLFRERYVLNSIVSDFFSEESPALSRLSQDFATSLVSSILNSTIP